MGDKSDLRYTVVAVTDLRGYSSHLEISNYDLRTKIGADAITRLENLEKIIQLIKKEKEDYSDFYPKDLFVRRINDLLILSVDMPDILTPDIGAEVRNGYSVAEMEKYFDIGKFETFEDAMDNYSKKLRNSIHDLILFVGLISRIHQSITAIEAKQSFPGVKTVISTGYRRPFIIEGTDDCLSANFAFSNAYLAEQKLKGTNFCVDSNVLQLLSTDPYSLNLIKRSFFIAVQCGFDPFQESSEPLQSSVRILEGESFPMALFRKKFWFREVNPKVLGFLQIIPKLLPYLDGKIARRIKGKLNILDKMKYVPTKNDLEAGKGLQLGVRFDMEDNINSMFRFVVSEKSDIQETQ